MSKPEDSETRNSPAPKGCSKTAILAMFGLFVLIALLALNLSENPKPSGFLEVDTLSDRTVHADKDASVVDPGRKIAETISRITGKKWLYGGSRIPALTTGNSVVPGEVHIYRAKKPLLSGKSWYRITIADGILIEAASEQGFQRAAEHFAELFEFEENKPQLPRGEFLARHRRKKISPEKRNRLVAIRPDAEKVKITGRITLPDGSPAKNVHVDVRDFCIMLEEEHITYMSGATEIPGGYPSRTDENGKFELQGVPGSILILGVYREPVQGNLVSEPVCFTPSYFSEHPLEIPLRPGIPITVRVQHEDGSPVQGIQVDWKRSFPPPIESMGDENIEANCNIQHSLIPQDGKTTFFLPPGEYELKVRSLSHKEFAGPEIIEVKDGGHYDFLYEIPNPARIRMLDIEGNPLVHHKIKLLHTGDHLQRAEIVDIKTDENGFAPVYLWEESNYVFAMSEDGRSGIIHRIYPQNQGETTEVKLEKTAEYTVNVRNQYTHDPIPDRRFQNQINITTGRGSGVNFGHCGNLDEFKTDSQGNARFFLPPIPPGSPHLKYEPLLGHPLDPVRTDTITHLELESP